MVTCPAAELVDGSRVLYFEQVYLIPIPCLCTDLYYIHLSCYDYDYVFYYTLLITLSSLGRHFGELLPSPFGRYPWRLGFSITSRFLIAIFLIINLVRMTKTVFRPNASLS